MYAYFSLYLNATQSYLEQQKEDEKQLFFCAHCEREKNKENCGDSRERNFPSLNFNNSTCTAAIVVA